MNKLLLLILLLLILLIVLLILFGGFGFGFGEKGDGGETQGSGASVSVQGGEEGADNAEAADISPERMVEYADVTVAGNSYLYDSGVTELDELTDKLGESDCVVRITDEGATQNAMEDLINALEQKDISYIMSDDTDV